MVRAKYVKQEREPQITNRVNRMKNNPAQIKRKNAATKDVPVPKILATWYPFGRSVTSLHNEVALFGM
jgi:hypothetical protein